MKQIIKKTLLKLGYEVKKINPNLVNKVTNEYEGLFYRPLWCPWFADDSFSQIYHGGQEKTLVSRERCYVLYSLLKQALHISGDIFECGVYKGGTAKMILSTIEKYNPSKKLYLFDTFSGMPEVDAQKDWHKKGDFADTDLLEVKKFLGDNNIYSIKKGFIPNTFSGLSEIRIAFSHIDLDIYNSIIDSLEFIWQRTVPGGFIVFDDYGFPTCPGARAAVDNFFSKTSHSPLCLQTGQAIVFK